MGDLSVLTWGEGVEGVWSEELLTNLKLTYFILINLIKNPNLTLSYVRSFGKMISCRYSRQTEGRLARGVSPWSPECPWKDSTPCSPPSSLSAVQPDTYYDLSLSWSLNNVSSWVNINKRNPFEAKYPGFPQKKREVPMIYCWPHCFECTVCELSGAAGARKICKKIIQFNNPRVSRTNLLSGSPTSSVWSSSLVLTRKTIIRGVFLIWFN